MTSWEALGCIDELTLTIDLCFIKPLLAAFELQRRAANFNFTLASNFNFWPKVEVGVKLKLAGFCC